MNFAWRPGSQWARPGSLHRLWAGAATVGVHSRRCMKVMWIAECRCMWFKGYAHCRRLPVAKIDNCTSKTANHRLVIGDRSTLPQQNAFARYYTTHVNITQIVFENLLNMVPKSSQNLSEIELWEGLEATLEPPVCRGCPKTSFLTILLCFGTPFVDQFWVILDMFFWVC